jgi:hypothetical protein
MSFSILPLGILIGFSIIHREDIGLFWAFVYIALGIALSFLTFVIPIQGHLVIAFQAILAVILLIHITIAKSTFR